MRRKELLKLLEPCDIIFSFKRGNYFSKLIWIFSKWGKNKFKRKPMISHVMLYIGDGMVVESAIGVGVGIRNIRALAGLYKLRIGRYKGKNLGKEKLINYCTRRVGKVRYAYVQLLAIAFKKIFKMKQIGDVEKNAVHCSEFIINAFKAQKIKLVEGVTPAETSPLDIFNSKLVAIIHG